MEKQNIVSVEVCCGTTCYLLGAQELLKLESSLPDPWKGKVEIIAKPCLEACTNDNFSKAPFVRINGEMIGNATVDLIAGKVNAILAERSGK